MMETAAAAVQTMSDQDIVIALAGNPNAGKTSIFNALTGARQHVGNWPGVTVEKKEGFLFHQGRTLRIVDLPGTYSLGAYAEDERITCNFILQRAADIVINVVDASNLRRNLYFTTQLREMGVKLVVDLNMIDAARANQIHIDIQRLGQLLGAPVVETTATQKEGIKELVVETVGQAEKNSPEPLIIDYGKEIQEEAVKLAGTIIKNPILDNKYPAFWLAIKLLERDQALLEEVKDADSGNILAQLATSSQYLRTVLGDEVEAVIVERRQDFVSGLLAEVVENQNGMDERPTFSDKIDRIVTNKYLGLPVFLLVVWGMFQFTFGLGNPVTAWIEIALEQLGNAAGGLITNPFLSSLVVDALIGGLGSVLVFLPPILLLFLAISFLEDSGYMARGAYVMDRFMRCLGLQGKSFLPLLLGLGCNVPAILATRTLENRFDRLITIMINPLMSCAARLPVYVLFAGALFPACRGLVVFSVYLLGAVLAIVLARLFRRFLSAGESPPFVLELPPYRVPTLKGSLMNMWSKGSSFLRKAGTIIFGAALLIWLLSNLPPGVEYASRGSLVGRLGAIIAPLLAPAGFGTWQAGTALVLGVVAKELVVSTLGVVYGMGEEGLSEVIRLHWTALSAYSFMVMVLVYIPCAATIGAIRRETNSWGWTAFAVLYSLFLGWILAVGIYQVGRLLGLQ